ncbi:hypothetical protein OAD25_01565 [Gammaproteobacteria bacterium]|jgi:hypothetical protein|nr:hypothetical protein [Gammaproteobacteria bacterium]
MKTSSKIILENLKLNKEFRFNIEMLSDDKLKNRLFMIMTHLEDFNNKDTKESDKLFALESIVNEFIEVTNKLVSEFLFKQNLTIYKQKKNIERLKSFLEIEKEVEDELPKPSNKSKEPTEPSLSPKEKEIMRKLNI